MSTRRAFVLSLVAACAAVAGPAVSGAEDLNTILRSMDKTAAGFRGLKADVEWTKYTKIVDVKSVESGVINVMRNKDGSVNMMIEFQKPYPYFFLIRGTQAQIYRPKINQVEEYDLSKSKDTLDQALLLGFGTAGKFLEQNYKVDLKGEEQVAGESTVKLELVPKSPDLQRNIQKLEMWVSKKTWHPVQEKLYEPTAGDYRLYTYNNIEFNPAQKDSQFKLKLPGNVKKVTPQK